MQTRRKQAAPHRSSLRPVPPSNSLCARSVTRPLVYILHTRARVSRARTHAHQAEPQCITCTHTFYSLTKPLLRVLKLIISQFSPLHPSRGPPAPTPPRPASPRLASQDLMRHRLSTFKISKSPRRYAQRRALFHHPIPTSQLRTSCCPSARDVMCDLNTQSDHMQYIYDVACSTICQRRPHCTSMYRDPPTYVSTDTDLPCGPGPPQRVADTQVTLNL